MTPHKLKTFAHHQAAHAVAHHVLKIGFRSVTLNEGEPHFAAARKGGKYTEAHAIACYAGAVAQRKSGHRGRITWQSVCDFKECSDMLGEWIDKDDLSGMLQGQLARARADALVERHWEDIQAVAHQLLERKRLSHADVVKAIQGKNG